MDGELIEVQSGTRVSEIEDGLIDLANGWVVVATGASVHLLDAATGGQVAASAALETGVSFDAIAVGADGRVVAAVSTGQVVRWDRSGSELIAAPAIQAPPDVGSVRDLVGSADGQPRSAGGVERIRCCRLRHWCRCGTRARRNGSGSGGPGGALRGRRRQAARGVGPAIR